MSSTPQEHGVGLAPLRQRKMESHTRSIVGGAGNALQAL